MNKKPQTAGKNQMLIPTIVMAVIALVLFIVAYKKGDNSHIIGTKSAMQLTIQILPLLLFALIIAGLAQQLLPKDLLARWIGGESGFKGILIGTLAGALTPGGPYVSFPIAAALFKTGANVGVLVAFVASWSLLSITRLPLEIGILGWKFAVIRTLSVLIFPPIIGLFANFIARFIKI